jgi:hypothetical protein
MATAARFVQPIPILWAYLVPLFFLHFGRFHGNGSHFGKINP